DIARTITTSLRMPLGLKPGENLVNNRNINAGDYQLFLRALALSDYRQFTQLTDASRMLEQVVERNPNYAPAWSLLCAVYFLTGNRYMGNDPRPASELRPILAELLEKADAAGRRAIALDPGRAEGYGVTGGVSWARGKAAEAADYF